MGAVVLYIVSLGLFWVASMLAPFVLMPALWLIRPIVKGSIPTIHLLFPLHVLVTIGLLYFTQWTWSLLGFSIGWFPALVAVQNFIASRAQGANAASRSQSVAVVVGAVLFMAIMLLQ